MRALLVTSLLVVALLGVGFSSAFAQAQCVMCALVSTNPTLWECWVVPPPGYDSCTTTGSSCSVEGICTGGGGCFLAGVLVTTPLGAMAIENLRLGDKVMSQDEHGMMSVGTVSRKHKSISCKYLVINKTLRVTDSHPFMVNGKWITAGELRLGDPLSTPDGKSVVESIDRVDRGVRVYNIEVDSAHTFFVNNLLVHNKPPEID